MDDQIAFSEFAEIDLGAVTFGASKPQESSRVDCESSEQLRSRENDEIGRWKTESARKRALDEIDSLNCPLHNFAEPLDLAFSLKINCDSGVVRAPFFQALDELRAFCLGEHQIAGAKLSNLTVLKRAAEIFRTSLNPAFADLDVRARNGSGSAGALARCFWRLAKNVPAGPRGACQCGRGARAPQSRRFFSRLDVDDQIALANVVANVVALVRRSLMQQNIDRAQIAHGSLRVDIELAQRFDLVAEKFQSKRQWRMPRIKIDNPAADSELATSGDL